MMASGDLHVELILTMICFSGVSSTLLVVNKLCMIAFPLPSTLLMMQFASSTLFVLSLKALGLATVDELQWPRVRGYVGYVLFFVASIYCNMQALRLLDVETVMVARATVPIFVSYLEYSFLNRDAPSARSVLSLLLVSSGAAGYATVDWQRVTHVGLLYAVAYVAILSCEITWSKHLLTALPFESKWGPTLYSNALALIPMTIPMLLGGELRLLAQSSYHERWDVVSLVGLSCILGIAMSFLVFRMTTLVSATSVAVFGVVNKVLTVAFNVLLIPNAHASNLGLGATLLCLGGASLYQQAPLRNDTEKGKSGLLGGRLRALAPLAGIFIVVGVPSFVHSKDSLSPSPRHSSSTLDFGASVPIVVQPLKSSQSGAQISRLAKGKLDQCVRTLEATQHLGRPNEQLGLAPYVYGGRRQVDVQDAFGRLIYCQASTLQSMNHFVDLFLFSGSGSTWTIAQGLQAKAGRRLKKKAWQRLEQPPRAQFSVTGWEGDAERFHLAQANLLPRFPAVLKNLRNRLTLERQAGIQCNISFACNIPHAWPLRGDLLEHCMARPYNRVDVVVLDGDVSHGLNDFDEWQVLNEHCQPAIINMFNTNIHQSHAKIVEMLGNDPDWHLLARGWVPFVRHFRHKNRTFHSFVHSARYHARIRANVGS